ncbi:hypothetical protein FACS189413_02010 [Bacteroidia bacterium]|nr:hypothetical protein FACS189413_02010 [Bacteroidia bacterium]
MKKTVFTAIILLATFGQMDAGRSDLKDRADSWLQSSSGTENTGGGNLRGDRFGDEIGGAKKDPGVGAPAGEGWLILTVLAVGYAGGRKMSYFSLSWRAKRSKLGGG